MNGQPPYGSLPHRRTTAIPLIPTWTRTDEVGRPGSKYLNPCGSESRHLKPPLALYLPCGSGKMNFPAHRFSVMPLSYETLYAFHSQQGHLLEIKRLDLPSSATKDQVYHWLWVTTSAVSSLKFVGMETGDRQFRQFREAHLSFDDAGGELVWRDGNVIALTNARDREPDALRRRLIRNHLS